MRVFVVTYRDPADAMYQIGVADSIEAAQGIAGQDYETVRWVKADGNQWDGKTATRTLYRIQEFVLVRSEWR